MLWVSWKGSGIKVAFKLPRIAMEAGRKMEPCFQSPKENKTLNQEFYIQLNPLVHFLHRKDMFSGMHISQNLPDSL